MPKEKAQELVNKYINASFNCKDCNMPYCDMRCTQLNLREAKECALILVEEIQQVIQIEKLKDIYWEEVKKEINNLKQ